MISKFLFFFLIIILSIRISFSSNVYKLKCKNVDDNTVHFFVIHKDYKIVNILPNGYEFDYILEQENNEKITAYFYQNKKNFIKKFVLKFNLNDNILYDEMYEGKNLNNLNLKDKKIFTCNNDK
tara:strand:- start:3118 stop:3489 length:372 start_codon:yes stop_codon:yes gene_type:complete